MDRRYVIAQLRDPQGVRLEIAEIQDMCTTWSQRNEVMLAPTMCSVAMRRLGRALLHEMGENDMLRALIKEIEESRVKPERRTR